MDPAEKETQYAPTEVRIKRSVQHEPEGYSHDVRSAFSGLPKVKPQWRDHYMKMLIVGECGQGMSSGKIVQLDQQVCRKLNADDVQARLCTLHSINFWLCHINADLGTLCLSSPQHDLLPDQSISICGASST